MKADYTHILEDCIKIANEREGQYGKASDSIKEGNAILKTTFGIDLTDKELCYVIIALKLSRQKFQEKDDNILDVCNYLAIALTLK